VHPDAGENRGVRIKDLSTARRSRDRVIPAGQNIDSEFYAGTFKKAPANRNGPMAAPAPEMQTKIAFARAFLVELEKGDTALATLFARAFAVQGLLVNGPASPGAAR
jgi:hypothetical protein